MGIYIDVKYFRAVHYYYFCIGIFSFTTAVMLGFPYILYLMVLCIINSAISWYVSWFMHRSMKRFVVPNSRGYMAAHVVLTLIMSVTAILFWFYQLSIGVLLIEWVLYVNFLSFFMGLIWYMMSRFSMVKQMFDYFSLLSFRRAKSTVISTREKMGLMKLMTDMSINDYEPGDDQEIDSVLISISKGGEGGIREKIYQLETMLCAKAIENLRNRIHDIESKGHLTATERKIIRSYEKFIRDYERKAVSYEKFFSRKGMT